MLSLNKYIRLNEGTVGTLNADAGINNMIDANDISMAILCILVYGLIRQGFKNATLKKIGAEFFRISHGILADGTDILKKVIDDKIKNLTDDEKNQMLLAKLYSMINDGNGNLNINSTISMSNQNLIKLEKEIENIIRDNEELQNNDKTKAKNGLDKLIIFVRNLNKNENL